MVKAGTGLGGVRGCPPQRGMRARGLKLPRLSPRKIAMWGRGLRTIKQWRRAAITAAVLLFVVAPVQVFAQPRDRGFLPPQPPPAAPFAPFLQGPAPAPAAPPAGMIAAPTPLTPPPQSTVVPNPPALQAVPP